MPETQELLDQARALGRVLANHQHVKAYSAARAKVEKDSETQQLLEAYGKQAERMRQLEAEQKPIEVADKRKLAECEQQMASNAALKELMRTQADYVALMNQINKAMETPLTQTEQSANTS